VTEEEETAENGDEMVTDHNGFSHVPENSCPIAKVSDPGRTGPTPSTGLRPWLVIHSARTRQQDTDSS